MNTELPKEVPYGQRAKVGDAPKTDARLESPPLETNTKLLKDSICTLATNTGNGNYWMKNMTKLQILKSA